MTRDPPAFAHCPTRQRPVETGGSGALTALAVAAERQICATQIGECAGDRGQRLEVRHATRGRRDQLCRIGMIWRSKQGHRWRGLDDMPGMHDRDMVAIFRGEAEIVRYQERRSEER